MNMVEESIMEVKSQSKVWLTTCPSSTRSDRKQPNCYIHLKEVGGVNEFWAMIRGENALFAFKPGEIVKVKLSFNIHKGSRKISQRAQVDEISLAMPWDYTVKNPWEV